MSAVFSKAAFGAAIIAASLALGAAPAHAGLIGYYDFENSDAADSSGNGNHGTVGGGGGISFAANGVGGSVAANFSGANGIANMINTGIDINASAIANLTMGAFVNAGIGVSPSGKVLSHDNGGFDRTLGLDTRGGSGGFAAFTGGGVLNSNTNPAVGFDFIAVRYNGTTVTLTVNGTHFTGTDFTGSDVSHLALYIGGNPGHGENWKGQIDNVFVFDHLLNDQELDKIYQDGGIDTNPVPVPATGLLMAGIVAFAGLRALRNR